MANITESKVRSWLKKAQHHGIQFDSHVRLFVEEGTTQMELKDYTELVNRFVEGRNFYISCFIVFSQSHYKCGFWMIVKKFMGCLRDSNFNQKHNSLLKSPVHTYRMTWNLFGYYHYSNFIYFSDPRVKKEFKDSWVVNERKAKRKLFFWISYFVRPEDKALTALISIILRCQGIFLIKCIIYATDI